MSKISNFSIFINLLLPHGFICLFTCFPGTRVTLLDWSLTVPQSPLLRPGSEVLTN